MIHIHPMVVAIRDSFVMFSNVLGEGTLAATNTAAGSHVANILGPQTYDSWTPSSVPSAAYVTLSAPATCDCAAIIAHNIGSKGAKVDIQYHNGTTYLTVAQLSPTDDADLFFIFPETTSDRWRVHLSDAAASIGVAMIGRRLLIPSGVVPDYVPVYRSLNIELMSSTTLGGQYVGTRRKRTSAGASIQLAPQDLFWVETEFDDFIAHYNSGLPFIWASCPDELPRDAAYCWRAGATIQPSLGAAAQYAAISMEVSAYVGG